ncbi:hypothetical protein BKA64DRAFT_645515 [Cadophora sp. MPI-SDFR-AT-0126]|nr:hypothetical protein BKA64DRAFT_645515 [Leotiomycetes sp. MPI-SDFR-AT-0126]
MSCQEILPALELRLPNSQSQCLFFSKLPPEIRRIIFLYVMSDWGWTERLHIIRDYKEGDFGAGDFNSPGSSIRKRRLTYVPCTAISEPTPAISMTMRWPTQHNSCRGWKALDGFPPEFRGLYLAFSLTCRRIHSEATALLYTQHTFDLLDMPTAHRFLRLVPLPHLQHIQCLHLTVIFSAQQPHPFEHPNDGTNPNSQPNPVPVLAPRYSIAPEETKKNVQQWKAICSVLSKMNGLSKLIIRIYRDAEAGVEERDVLLWLAGVRLKAGGEFVVRMPWSRGEVGWAEGVVLPFVVERISKEGSYFHALISDFRTQGLFCFAGSGWAWSSSLDAFGDEQRPTNNSVR